MRPTRSTTPPRDAQMIVEDQVRKWRMEKKEEQAAREEGPPWPVVTVSREHGSLGSAVAQKAAKLLDFSFWDQELVHLIAKQTDAEEALVASLDERSRSRIEDFVSEVLVGIEGSVAEYVRHVARVVKTLGGHGSAVIVGRGAQFILDPSMVFRVRVVCPRAIRAARIADLHGLSRKEAERRIQQVGRERRTFIRRHYGYEIGEPRRYDLVVNTGHISIESAAAIVAAAYRIKYPTPQEAAVPVPDRALESRPFNPKL